MHLAQSLATLRLEPHAATPLFRQLYEGIRQAILSGIAGPGTRLPPTRDLAQQLGVSRQTVLNAYDQLMAEGYLSGKVGRGTFVSASLPLAPARPARPGLLRPLSERGVSFTGPQAYLNIHEGDARAFRIGMPALDIFPFGIWARLEARRWRKASADLGYGDPAGYRPLREALALYLRAARGVQCTPEQVIITSGSQQALFLIATMLLSPGDQAWVEEPGYRGINASLRGAGAMACPVAVDAEGLRVEDGARRWPQAKLAYVTPTHQLPLGMTMSLQRRLELLAWAAERRMWLVEDDYDSEFRYTGPPLASLQSLDRAGSVLYVGSMSKVLFPGLRIGYLVVPEALGDAFAQGKAILDRHTALMPQAVLTDFINEGHYGRHIRRAREAYAERRQVLLDAIERHLPDELAPGCADTGLHLPVSLPAGRDDEAVARAGAARGLELRALSQFCNESPPEGRARPSGLLLGFAAIPPAEIRWGVLGLRDLLRST